MVRFFMLFGDLGHEEIQAIRRYFTEAGYQKCAMDFDLVHRAIAVYAAGKDPPYALLSHPKLRAYHHGAPLDTGYVKYHFGEKLFRVALAYNDEFLAALMASLVTA